MINRPDRIRIPTRGDGFQQPGGEVPTPEGGWAGSGPERVNPGAAAEVAAGSLCDEETVNSERQMPPVPPPSFRAGWEIASMTAGGKTKKIDIELPPSLF